MAPMPTAKTQKESDYLRKIYLIHGIPKIGKSTLASKLGDDKNKVLFFATEAGHKELEIYKWQKQRADGTLEDPTSWDDFKTCVREMVQQTEYRFLAIDTADNLFQWCTKTILDQEKVKHESDLSFGKGYQLVAREFFPVVNFLTQKGFGLLFISHSNTSERELRRRKITYTDSTLSNTAKKIVHGMADYIFHLGADDDGNRIIYTKGTEHINAGDRGGKLPAIMPLDAELLKRALASSKPIDLEIKNIVNGPGGGGAGSGIISSVGAGGLA